MKSGNWMVGKRGSWIRRSRQEVGELQDCHSWAKLMSVFIIINYFLINFKYDSLPVQAY